MRGWEPERPKAAMRTLACLSLKLLYVRKKYVIFVKPLSFGWLLLHAANLNPNYYHQTV